MREGFGEHWLGELLKVKGDIEFILVHPPGVKPSPVNDPRMKQIVCALRGEIIQRSTGFLNTRGTYILTINCDEYLHTEIVTLVKDYFDRFPNSWVLRLARRGFPYGEREKLESTWPTIPDVNSLAICSRRENNSNLFKDNNYLLELPIAPLDNPFNPQVFLNQRRDQNGPHLENFDKNVLDKFSYLDDYDVLGAIRSWQFHDDYVLQSLSKMILNRDLLKIQMSDDKPNKENLLAIKNKYISIAGISEKEADYFVFKGKLKNQAYSKSSEPIYVLKKDKTIEDVVEASDQMYLKALSKEVTKYYICFPKVVLES